MPTIFVSYSWADSHLVDDIDNRFKEIGLLLTRDKRDLKFRNNMSTYMKRIKNADYVLMVISENYLKSVNCMYEVTELIKDDEYREKIIPLITESAKIFRPTAAAEYLRFWNHEYREIEKNLEEFDRVEINTNELRDVNNIKLNVYSFIEAIKNLRCLVVADKLSQEDFNTILVEIGQQQNAQELEPPTPKFEHEPINMRILGIGNEGLHTLSRLYEFGIEEDSLVPVDLQVKKTSSKEPILTYDNEPITEIPDKLKLSVQEAVFTILILDQNCNKRIIALLNKLIATVDSFYICFLLKPMNIEAAETDSFNELQMLKQQADSYFILNRQHIFDYYKKSLNSLRDIFEYSDYCIYTFVKTLKGFICAEAMINLDIADIICILQGKEIYHFSITSYSKTISVKKLVLKIAHNRVLNTVATGSEQLILMFDVPDDTQFNEITNITSKLFDLIANENANMIFGVNLNKTGESNIYLISTR